jgi:predicted DsbA family dithiol-disulfide isomerase
MSLERLFSPARAQAMRSHVRQFAAGFGVGELDAPSHLPNTRRALAIAEWARGLGSGALDRFRAAAMRAHWRAGRDLERDEHLRAIAVEAGLDPDAALAAADGAKWQARVDAVREEGHDLGVTGVPTFFFGELPVVGCQPYERLARAAARAGARRR